VGKTHVLNVIFALTRDEGAAVRRRIVDVLFFFLLLFASSSRLEARRYSVWDGFIDRGWLDTPAVL